MEFEQVYYTSSSTGLTGGGAGYRIHSATDGCPRNLFDELLERHVYFHEGDNFRQTPEHFQRVPLRFTYYTLNSGWKFISQTVFNGMRDSSGRLVNFTHFILTNNKLPGFQDSYPISFWRNPVFWNEQLSTTNELPSSTTLEPLSALEPSFHPVEQDLQGFLSEPDHIEQLAKMISAVETYNVSSKRVIICDEPDRVALWIYILCQVFPKRLADTISFSTYEYDPIRGCDYVVTGTTLDTKFSRAERIEKQICHIFDFMGTSENPDIPLTPFATIVKELVQERQFTLLNHFRHFCEEVQADIDIIDMTNLALIYFCQSQIPSIRQSDIASALNLFKRLPRLPIEVATDYIQMLMDVSSLDENHYQQVKTLLEWSRQTQVSFIIARHIADSYFSYFLNVILISHDALKIKEISRYLSVADLDDSFWITAEGSLVRRLNEPSTGVETTIYLVSFINDIHPFPYSALTIRTVFDRLLPSLFSNEKVWPILRSLLERDDGKDAQLCLLEYLKSSLDSPNTWERLILLLEKIPVNILKELLDQVSQQRLLALYVRLLPLQHDFRLDRVQSLQRAYHSLKLMCADDATRHRELKNIVQLLWPHPDRLFDEYEIHLIENKHNYLLEVLYHDDLYFTPQVFKVLLDQNTNIFAFDDKYQKHSRPDMITLTLQRIRENAALQKQPGYKAFSALYKMAYLINQLEEKYLTSEIDDTTFDIHLAIWKSDFGYYGKEKAKQLLIGHLAHQLIHATPDYQSHSSAFEKAFGKIGMFFLQMYDVELFHITNQNILPERNVITIFRTLTNASTFGEEGRFIRKILFKSFRNVYIQTHAISPLLRETLTAEEDSRDSFISWEKKAGLSTTNMGNKISLDWHKLKRRAKSLNRLKNMLKNNDVSE